jgi:hypothetical protein
MRIKKFIFFAISLLAFSFIPKKDKIKSVFLNIEGFVTIDGKPVRAAIEISSLVKHKKFDLKTNANPLNGNFESKLPGGDEYEIVIKVSEFPQQVITLSTLNLKKTLSLNVFADFTSPEYDKKLEDLIKSSEKNQMNSSVPLTTFSSHYGHLKKEALEYKIQIAAFKFYENFNYNNTMGLPKIIRKTYTDQVTRFTMGNFETYNEALLLLDKVKKNNLNSAFVVAIYKGEQKLLQQLVEEKILN